MLFALGCETTNTVVAPEGPKVTELLAAKDKQIDGLVAQVKREQEQRKAEQEAASLAAANFESILFAAEHLNQGLPRDAVEAEAKLGKERSPAPKAEEVAKGKDRVIAILNEEVAKTKKLYDEAYGQASQAKKEIENRDEVIRQKAAEISMRQQDIVRLEQEKILEQDNAKKALQAAIDKKDAEIARIKNEAEEKHRNWMLNLLGYGSVGCIIVGIGVIALTKGLAWAQGGLLILGGSLCIFIKTSINIVISQPWFPYAAGVVGLIILGGGGWAIYHLWKTNQLHSKVSAALQDLRDEATAQGSKLWESVEPHLKYRLGDKESFWGKAQMATLGKLGLIDEAGEKKLEEEPSTQPVDAQPPIS